MDKRQQLLNLMSDDPFNLLDEGKRKQRVKAQTGSPLLEGFEDINSFIDENGKEPQSNPSNIREFMLYSRLKAIRADSTKIRLLKEHDRHNLLEGIPFREMSLEDVFADDDQHLLSCDCDTSIFKLRHVEHAGRIQPQYLARRRVCKDFNMFQDMFETINEELDSHKRHLVPYSSDQLRPESFFVLSGIVIFLKEIDGKKALHTFDSGDRIRFDGRTRCIFDNGTESDMLFRSLDKALQIDGYSISELEEPSTDDLNCVENVGDTLNGYIYVLRSKNPQVQSVCDLYKIGYTSGTVAARIKNAKQEATYLFDDVEVVSTFRCLNLDSFLLEQSIHNFFSQVKLDIKLLDRDGNFFEPKEWFSVPLPIIDEAIAIIVSGHQDDFMYDGKIKKIIKRRKKK